jgi:hypothetical protein
MSLVVDRSIYDYSGGTFVAARRGEAHIVRSGRTVERFVAETSIDWVKVAPDGRTVLIYTDRVTRIWRWRDGVGLDRFVKASDISDKLGCGFINVGAAIVTLVSKQETLNGLGVDDRVLFTSNLSSPESFAPRSFSQLPGDRLALTGSFFSDPYNVVVTVRLDDLFRDPDAVQKAIDRNAAVYDRAIRVAAGPCDPNAAVVLRDPEDREIPDEDAEEDEDRSDVENFAGVYIRELDTRRLLERYEYTGRAFTGTAIIATGDWIAVQVAGGVDLIRRGIGAPRHVPGAILDAWGSQLAIVAGSQLVSVTPIDSAV